MIVYGIGYCWIVLNGYGCYWKVLDGIGFYWVALDIMVRDVIGWFHKIFEAIG